MKAAPLFFPSHDLRRGLVDEAAVGEFILCALKVFPESGDLPGQPRQFGVAVDDGPERYQHGQGTNKCGCVFPEPRHHS
ncbi:MAG: hypothetical protein CM1200mP20_02500 [Pseudomonadota bacterium]|nr:MAG: hypothetical protein CM1200mP20_02500 [Pseudomonadota bacterium]